MKRIVLTVAFLACNSISASATDLLAQTPPVAAPTYNWSGFYAG